MFRRPGLPFVVLIAVIAACGFDSGGLQTGSNSAGTLESSGSEGGEGPSTTASTNTTASTSASTTSEPTTTTTDDTTTSPTTTTPSDTSADASTTGGEDTTTTSTASDSQGSSSESGGGSSSDSGGFVPYGMCDPEGDDCGDGLCVTVYMSGEHFVCYPPCMGERDCPAPDGGTASPVCTDSGCGLDCEPDPEGCPAGMECGYVNGGFDRRCMWP